MSSVVYLLRSYPRSSQTFVLNEILSLEKRGVDVSIVAMSKADDSVHQPMADEIQAPVTYLGQAQGWSARAINLASIARRQPLRLFSTIVAVARAKGIDRGYTAAGRFECLFFATELANLLSNRTDQVHIHAHFAHDPAYVAMLTRQLTGTTFSFTGHARDLYQIDAAFLAERVNAATFVATVTEHNRQFIRAAAPDSTTPVQVVPQGTNTTVFSPTEQSVSATPLSFLAIGRLVPKKGFDVLIAACRMLLDTGLDFDCTIVGEGPEDDALQALIAKHDLASHVTIASPVVQSALAAQYGKCDVFVLPAVVTADGDSDALPTVLLEAMSCGRPVISTPVGGIAELVSHDVNGLLVEPGNATALAQAMTRLATNAPERQAMGSAARDTVLNEFDHQMSITAMMTLLGVGASDGQSAPDRVQS